MQTPIKTWTPEEIKEFRKQRKLMYNKFMARLSKYLFDTWDRYGGHPVLVTLCIHDKGIMMFETKSLIEYHKEKGVQEIEVEDGPGDLSKITSYVG